VTVTASRQIAGFNTPIPCHPLTILLGIGPALPKQNCAYGDADNRQKDHNPNPNFSQGAHLSAFFCGRRPGAWRVTLHLAKPPSR